MTTIKFDFREFLSYEGVIANIQSQLPHVQRTFLRNVAARYRTVISDAILGQNIRYTGTYEQSIKIIETGSDRQPQISLILDPSGPEASRLPLYWTVLEFGSGPNPNVPSRRIVEWASVKFGDPSVGFLVANKIRSGGINPHPIISNVFVLSTPSGDPIGLTNRSLVIAEEEASNIMDRLESLFTESSFARRGREVTQFRIPAGFPGGGQFTRGPV